jgi:hypothetical protein
LAIAQEPDEPREANEVETVDSTPFPPWIIEDFAQIEIEPDKESAIEQAGFAWANADRTVYSDASGRQGHL